MQISGTLLKVSDLHTSASGTRWMTGVLRDSNNTLQEFTLFVDDNDSLPEIRIGMRLNLAGKLDKKSGGFTCSFIEEQKIKTYSENNSYIENFRYAGDDAINGLKPIEYVMNLLGSKFVSNLLKQEFGTWSNVLSNKNNREKYKQILNGLITKARQIENGDTF